MECFCSSSPFSCISLIHSLCLSLSLCPCSPLVVREILPIWSGLWCRATSMCLWWVVMVTCLLFSQFTEFMLAATRICHKYQHSKLNCCVGVRCVCIDNKWQRNREFVIDAYLFLTLGFVRFVRVKLFAYILFQFKIAYYKMCSRFHSVPPCTQWNQGNR